MIDPDVEIVDLEDLRLRRLLALLAEAGARESEARAAGAGGMLVLVYEGERVVKAVLRGRRLPPEDVTFRGPHDLPPLRARFDVDVVLALRRDAPAEAFDRFQRSTRFEAPYLDQAVAAARAWRSLVGESVHLEPPGPLVRWGIPSARLVRQLGRVLLPPRRVAVFYVLERGPGKRRVAASLIVRQGRGGHIDLITTDAHLEGEGLDAVEWRSDAERLTESIGRRIGRVHVSCFLEVHVLSELAASGFAWDVVARALRSGRLVLLHRPWWLRFVLASWWRRLLGRTRGPRRLPELSPRAVPEGTTPGA